MMDLAQEAVLAIGTTVSPHAEPRTVSVAAFATHCLSLGPTLQLLRRMIMQMA